jgi:vancomycin aglycone glucosyltransferase
MFTDRPWLAADPTLGPWPDPADEGVFQTGSWILPDERPLARELDAFLASGAPPIYFGFGSTRAPQDAGPVILQATRTMGRRAIVSRGWFDVSLVENQADCLSIGEVNVHALFSRVAAVVHHGGAGTTTAAALAGAPQVVIPDRYAQHYWAQRVHTLGIGAACTRRANPGFSGCRSRPRAPAGRRHARPFHRGRRAPRRKLRSPRAGWPHDKARSASAPV